MCFTERAARNIERVKLSLRVSSLDDVAQVCVVKVCRYGEVENSSTFNGNFIHPELNLIRYKLLQ